MKTHRRFTQYWVIRFILVAIVWLTGCKTSEPRWQTLEPREEDPNLLRIGITSTEPPLIFIREDQPAGFEVDMAYALGRELKKEVRFVEVSWEDQISALLEHRIDIIMSGMSITHTRSLQIAFSEPYLKVGQMALARREDMAQYLTPYMVIFASERVGVEKGTTGEFFVQKNLTQARIASFSSAEEAAQALVSHRIDLLVHDAPVIWWLAASLDKKGISPEIGRAHV